MKFPAIDDAVVERFDAPGPRYTSYPTVPVWRSLDAGTYDAALRRAATHPDRPLSLYFHLPFCESQCTYCGCNVVITDDRARAERYIDVLLKEMDLVLERLGDRRSVAQIHWGGGTPTFLDEAQIARLMGAIDARFRRTDDAEVAIELDPGVTTDAQLRLLAQLGFNRVSIGVQDLDEDVQRTVNRLQSNARIAELRSLARELGFEGVNFDLIYGLPLQTPARWKQTLEGVIEMRPDRLAVYSFAYLPDLRKQQRKLPLADIPTGIQKLALFGQAYDALVDAGYEPIGMDHFALPDDELARAKQERRLGRNFQGYTVKAAPDVVAFGISGIGDVDGLYAQSVRGLSHYYELVEAGILPVTRGFETSEDDRQRRKIINDLMCNGWARLLAEPDDELSARLAALAADGLVRVDGREVEVTSLGRVFVRNVAMVFDAYLTPGAGTFSRTV